MKLLVELARLDNGIIYLHKFTRNVSKIILHI